MMRVVLDPRQADAFRLVQPGTVCVFPFGRGSGKTYLGRVLIHAAALPRPVHIGLLMPSLKQARAVFWPGLLADFYDLRDHVSSVNKTLLEAVYNNGSRLTTWGAENAQSIRGQRFDVLVQDEADDIEPDVETAVVEPTFSRSGTSSIWVKFGTPRRGRYGSLYRDFKRAEVGELDALGRRKYFGFKVRSADSPQVDQVWLAGIRKNLLATQPTVYHREYECDFDAADGLVYGMFTDRIHVREPDKSATWSDVLVGVDFGYEDPGTYIVVGVTGNGRDATAHVLEEVYQQHKTESWWVERAIEIRTRYPQAKWYCDPSQPARIEALRRSGGIKLGQTNNSIEEGVSAVADFMAIRRHEGGPEHARFAIRPQCKNTIQELSTYRRKRDPKNTERFLDDIEDRNNHAMDALRYAIFSRFGGPSRTRSESGAGW